MGGVDVAGNRRERLLLVRERDTLEDAVVAAAEPFALVVCEVGVLWHDGQVNLDETCDAPDGVVDGSDCLRHEQRSRGLNNDVTHAMPDEDLHRDLRVRLDLIGQIHNRAGNAVSDFVRVGRVYFLNHE